MLRKDIFSTSDSDTWGHTIFLSQILLGSSGILTITKCGPHVWPKPEGKSCANPRIMNIIRKCQCGFNMFQLWSRLTFFKEGLGCSAAQQPETMLKHSFGVGNPIILRMEAATKITGSPQWHPIDFELCQNVGTDGTRYLKLVKWQYRSSKCQPELLYSHKAQCERVEQDCVLMINCSMEAPFQLHSLRPCNSYKSKTLV